ncbi:hypothetical protein [Xenorhabdus lircayensis]|uniref:Uncharacterized protein n=1 Tax=Xenorhabdus lircayensis TaxID=2763499 RepID=A0ABS0U6X8_9GAMM|nr:hypothetical protein [Xenorhabdus lircayensis]MBI6548708.1 hypothetical protein [Xenorhabdus lircayensis]
MSDHVETNTSDTSFSTAFDGQNTQILIRAVDTETNWIVDNILWELTSPYIDCALYD